jgi:PKD repeat protein
MTTTANESLRKRRNVRDIRAQWWKVLSGCTLSVAVYDLLLFVPASALAASVALAWDPVSSPALAGYYLYYGPAVGNYTSKIDVGNATTRTVMDLAEGATFHFVVTAYDASHTESGYSNDVSTTIPFAAPVADFTASSTTGVAPLAVNFINSSTGNITSYAWTFGDGTTSTSPNPVHIYPLAGSYTVSLAATGPSGSNTRTISSYINVTLPQAVIVPLVAQTPSFNTEVYVRNAHGTPITLNVRFYEGDNSAVSGPRPCSQFIVPGFTTRQMNLGTQCVLGAGGHFGMLVLEDTAVPRNGFTVYSRTQTPGGNGFSVEGFPTEHFDGLSKSVEGLKRSSAGAKYQSNCFVSALDGAVEYRIDLRGPSDSPIGKPIVGALQPYHVIRYLDVLSIAGATSGDYSNVRAVVTPTGSTASPFIAVCTVQESITFGADFRIAKAVLEGTTQQIVPLVAQTASYSTEAYVRNSNPGSVVLNVTFYEAINSPTPGPHACYQLAVAGHTTRQLVLGTQCSLAPGAHFGMLVLEDAATPKSNTFTVYSRTQTPSGNGFSVEGVAGGVLAETPRYVEGLKRSSGGAKYLSNCFVGALGDAISYRLDLLTTNDAPIGAPIVGSLQPYQMVRDLDVLSVARAPAGDYSNVRAKFSVAGSSSPFIGFCTVQESVTFGADFRASKMQYE